MSGLRHIKTFSDPEEAQIAAGYLRAHGVDAMLADQDSLNTLPYLRVALGGFRILVPASHYDDARELLARTRSAVEDASGPACAMCGGRAFNPVKRRHWLTSMLVLFGLGVFFPVVRKTDKFECAHCGAQITRDDLLAQEKP